MNRRLRAGLAAVLATLLTLIACAAGPAPQAEVEVVRRLPHDPNAFTQGLELGADGALYESTGRYGASSVRRVDLETGEVEAIRWLSDDRFGEGLTIVGDTLIQLTWRAGEAYVWPRDGFERGDPPLRTFRYQGEGWGLCFGDEVLYMTDGSDRLTVRDPDTFEVVRSVPVRLDGEPLERLNELECVGGAVWANVWLEDRIVRIDPSDGRVSAWADLSGLLPAEERRALGADAVLNGLAWNEESGTMFATGKLWPALFELRLHLP